MESSQSNIRILNIQNLHFCHRCKSVFTPNVNENERRDSRELSEDLDHSNDDDDDANYQCAYCNNTNSTTRVPEALINLLSDGLAGRILGQFLAPAIRLYEFNNNRLNDGDDDTRHDNDEFLPMPFFSFSEIPNRYAVVPPLLSNAAGIGFVQRNQPLDNSVMEDNDVNGSMSSGSTNLDQDYERIRFYLDVIERFIDLTHPALMDLADEVEDNNYRPMAQECIESLSVHQITQEEVDAKLECSICKETYVIDENAITLICNHKFHQSCIVPWLELHSTCPVCREILYEGDDVMEMEEEVFILPINFDDNGSSRSSQDQRLPTVSFAINTTSSNDQISSHEKSEDGISNESDNDEDNQHSDSSDSVDVDDIIKSLDYKSSNESHYSKKNKYTESSDEDETENQFIDSVDCSLVDEDHGEKENDEADDDEKTSGHNNKEN